ncbi:hypothetical protein VNO78_12676 [Psophocarpus tetragonolobus]|uniref:Uncharacterized protein n=1 Tax=Psophocarpus tetragonolobus TaxID=3891 RepID=A0AAN9XPL6_PSOTE
MATLFCVSNPISHSSPSFVSSMRAPPFFYSPALRIAGDRRRRGSAMAARAGPSTSSILFAIALPSSLLAVTILAALKMGDRLDRQWLEEMAKTEALKELEEYSDDDNDEDDDDDISTEDDNMETYVQEEPALQAEPVLQEEPALPHTRNRPKRVV